MKTTYIVCYGWITKVYVAKETSTGIRCHRGWFHQNNKTFSGTEPRFYRTQQIVSNYQTAGKIARQQAAEASQALRWNANDIYLRPSKIEDTTDRPWHDSMLKFKS